MSYEERGTVYAIYLVVVLSQAADPITETPYQVPLLWSIGVAIVAAVVLRIAVEIGAGVARGVRDGVAEEVGRADVRDREIDRLGTLRTWWVLVAAALVALLMALAESPHIWIANVLYLGFVLQAVSSATVKLVAYRRGL